MPDGSLTRRRLLGTGAVAGAGALLPASQSAAAKSRTTTRKARRADVVVVGAGFAGLTAAREIAKAGKSVYVVEARDRVGGRVWNHEVAGEQSERGGTFVGPTQNRLLALAKDYGVEKFPTYDTGNNVYYNPDGQRFEYATGGPTGHGPARPDDPARAGDAPSRCSTRWRAQVPVDAPWQAAKAAEWDSQTLQTWIEQHTATRGFRDIVPLATRPIFGAEARELSLLFTLFYIAASGDETQPGHVRAQLQHHATARRCTASSAGRR